MSRCNRVVVKGDHPPSKIVVFRDNDAAVVGLVVVIVGERVFLVDLFEVCR